MRRAPLLAILLTTLCVTNAAAGPRRKTYDNRSRFIAEWLAHYPKPLLGDETNSALVGALTKSAHAQTKAHIVYNPDYFKIAYPGGDIPAGYGVCTDVLIRAYRTIGEDLQAAVHEDMLVAFDAYPNLWGRTTPDPNIDHRRVPNLMVFFARHGEILPITQRAADYRAGDIVAWDLGGGVTHIGLAVEERSADGARPLIVHNIGRGPELSDALFEYKIIGHFRYRPLVTERRRQLTREYAKAHYGLDSEKLKDPTIVVVHATEIATLADTLKTFAPETIAPARGYLNEHGDLNVGVHFVVDRDGTVYPQLPLDMIGRHAIGFNHVSVGIENVGTSIDLTPEQVEADAKLIAGLKKRLPTLKYLVGHHEYVEKSRAHYSLYRELDAKYAPTTKSDPGPGFMKSLRATLAARGLVFAD